MNRLCVITKNNVIKQNIIRSYNSQKMKTTINSSKTTKYYIRSRFFHNKQNTFLYWNRCLTTFTFNESIYSIDIKPKQYNKSKVLACSNKQNKKNIKQCIQKLYQFLHNLFLLLFRGTQISLQLSPLLLLSPLTIMESKLSKNSHRMENWSWNYLLQSLHNLGPAFVKLAQWAATRRDLFSPYICDHLSKLHNRAPPHSWKDTHKILMDSFGPNYTKDVRIHSQSEILGSGAVAQVYKGYLKGHGLVAIKVLHPKIIDGISRDFALMNAFALFLDALLPKDLSMSLSLPRAVQTFGCALNKQVDLTIEAKNLNQFRSYFSNYDHIDFPKPLLDWTTSNVMMEYLYADAKPISHYLNKNKEIRMELAQLFVKAFMKMVFIDNFIHCDLHPGNVLVQTKNGKPSIVFLDAGISTALSTNDLQNLKDLFQAVVLNQGEQVGRLMIERARYETCSQIPNGIDSFAKGMAELVQEFHNQKGLSLGLTQVGSLLKRVLDLCRIHGVEIDPAMSSIVVSVLILEGLGRSLDPDLDLIEYAIPFVMGKDFIY